MEKSFKGLTNFGIAPAPAKPDDPPPPTPLGNYQGSLRKIVAALTDHKQKGPEARADTKGLETEFQNAYQSTVALIAEQDAHTRDLIQLLLLRPITLTWSSVLNDAGKVSGAFWEMSVYKACEAKIHGRYPFDPSSSKDATLDDFNEFFRPKSGILWAFYEGNLKSAIDKKGDAFIPSQRFEQKNPYNSGFLDYLKRSDGVSQSFFTGDAKEAAISFDINLHSVSAEVAEVTFEIDGVSHTYKNTPEEWVTVAWPAKEAKSRGAKVRVRGFSGLAEEIPRMGDFGLFRLLSEGNLKPGTAGGRPGDQRTLVATWNIKSQRATVQMDLRASRSEHPFEKGFFSNYRCPSIITEATR
jgi:type VI secretion system protein ImpL